MGQLIAAAAHTDPDVGTLQQVIAARVQDVGQALLVTGAGGTVQAGTPLHVDRLHVGAVVDEELRSADADKQMRHKVISSMCRRRHCSCLPTHFLP